MRSPGIFALGLIATAFFTPAQARTVSAVIASDYRDNEPFRLANPIGDGRKIADALRRIGLSDVIVEENASASEIYAQLDKMLATMTAEDVAIVYFAGHAIQAEGRNFLLVGDGLSLIPLDQLLQRFLSKAKGVIFVVDACRNNPLKSASGPEPDVMEVSGQSLQKSRSISLEQLIEAPPGLSQMSDLRGLSAVVIFSTEPGNVAYDGEAGKGGPFASALAAELIRKQTVDNMFRAVAKRVSKSTQGSQIPWRQGDLAFDYYLAGKPHFPVP